MIFNQSERRYLLPECFSVYLPFSIFFCGVELKLCPLSDNVKIFLNGDYLQRCGIFYVGTILPRKSDG